MQSHLTAGGTLSEFEGQGRQGSLPMFGLYVFLWHSIKYKKTHTKSSKQLRELTIPYSIYKKLLYL